MYRLGIALLTGTTFLLAGCGSTQVGQPAPVGSVSASAAAGGDDAAACATVKAGRTAAFDDLLTGMMTIKESGASAASVTEASGVVKAGLEKLRPSLVKGGEQAADPALKTAIGRYATGVDVAIQGLAGAGGDQAKASAALLAFAEGEQAVLNLC